MEYFRTPLGTQWPKMFRVELKYKSLLGNLLVDDVVKARVSWSRDKLSGRFRWPDWRFARWFRIRPGASSSWSTRQLICLCKRPRTGTERSSWYSWPWLNLAPHLNMCLGLIRGNMTQVAKIVPHVLTIRKIYLISLVYFLQLWSSMFATVILFIF